MQEFIQMAMQQLGTSEETTTKATAGLLGTIKEKAGAAAFEKVLGDVPGIGSLLGGGGAAQAAGGGGGLGGALGGMLGGGGAPAAQGGGGLGGALGGMLGGGGGGGGGLGGALGGMLGDKMGGAGALVGMLGKSGMDMDKVMPFAQMLMNFLKEKVGGEALSGLVAQASPELAKLVD